MGSAVVRRVLLLSVMAWASLAVVSAQHGRTHGADSGARPSPLPTFRDGVDLVVMDVSVADGHHTPVAGLTRDDFAVFEDGIPQRISFFAAHQIPLDTALVFDTSASMFGELPAVQQCGAGFITSMGPGDRATVIELKERLNILAALTPAQAALEQALTRLTQGGQTALYDGLYVVLAQLASRSPADKDEIRSSVVTVLTDGSDTVSLLTFDQLLDQARREGVTIYVVRLQGKQLSRELSKQEILAAGRAMDVLAAETGGRVLATAPGDLASICGTIARELTERYTVGYVSTNARRDGRYRHVSVRLPERHDLLARTRAGYMVSADCGDCSPGPRK